MDYKIVIIIFLIFLVVYILSTNWYHLKRTEWFYSIGLDDKKDDSWELTFGYWDGKTNTYKKAAENLYDKLFSNMMITPESSVVSVGCGMGKELVYLYQKYKPKKIVAIDITYEHVRRARRLVEQHSLQGEIEIIHGSGTELDNYIRPNSMTHVFCIEAVNNMPSFTKFINGANEVLVDGGILAFSDGFTYKVHNDPKSILMTYLVSMLWSIHLSNNRTFYDLEYDLERSGFKGLKVIDLTDNVWKGYTDFKVKNYKDDIDMRGSFIYAKLFKTINEYLYWYTKTYDIRYLIYIGKKVGLSISEEES